MIFCEYEYVAQSLKVTLEGVCQVSIPFGGLLSTLCEKVMATGDHSWTLLLKADLEKKSDLETS